MSDSPYKMFDYYTFEDRHLFFGREEESLRMVGEILSSRLLVLFAPSGSGKSSLINAGVRPLLEDRGYRTFYVRMETDPATAIQQTLGASHEFGAGLPTPPEPPTEGLPASGEHTEEISPSDSTQCPALETNSNISPKPAPPHDPPGLHEFLRQTFERRDDNTIVRPLFISLDQFEELFTVYREQPQMRQDFIRQLAAIRYDTSLPVFFVLSLRDDYFVNLNEFREAIPSIFQNNANIQLRPLDDAAAERAIEKPARAADCEFEERLALRIIDDLKTLNPGGDGVLPITLQIVCRNLWLSKSDDENRISAAQYDRLGGARRIVDEQLNRSLDQIPRRYHRLTRRLFRVLMTSDLTKRLRSADDLAELLRVRPATQLSWVNGIVERLATVLPLNTHGKLESLLAELTDASILRTESRQGTAWYEFRHDYLVGQVASWVTGAEERLVRRRRIISFVLAVALPVLIWLSKAAVDFNTFVVSFKPHRAYAEQQEELWISRRFNPFGYHVETGLYAGRMYSGDIPNQDAENRLRKGVVLPFGQPTDWDDLSELLWEGKSAAFERSPELSSLRMKNWLDREPTSSVVVLGREQAAVVTALVEALKDDDVYVRRKAAEALGQWGQKRTDRTDEKMLELLQDNDSGKRELGGIVLAYREELSPEIVEQVRKLRKEPRPWVRMAALYALARIEEVRYEREQEAKQKAANAKPVAP